MAGWEYIEVSSGPSRTVTYVSGADGEIRRDGTKIQVVNELGAQGWEPFAIYASTGVVAMRRSA
jgi:hypothetical protein